MDTQTYERLLRLHQGTLPPNEAARVQRDLEHSPELRATLHEIKALHGLLQSTVDASAQHALKPFFTDRVMRRLAPIPQKLAAASQDEEFFAFLLRLFRPVALAGILLILGFATYNVAFSDAYVAETTATEAMLGLPPVTLTTAYTLDFETIPPIEP